MPDGFILAAVKAFALVNLLMGFFAIMTVTERKLIGRLQVRHGPNRVGPSASCSRSPTSASSRRSSTRCPGRTRALYLAAPFISLFAAIAAFA